jgi:DtxR family Mn-dependent transcriptional regulator
MPTFSISEENHIKAIYHLQHGDQSVSTNELAAELNTKPASITDMMKKLKAKKIIHYEAYKGFKLTPEGRKTALMIIRRHRLWEFFLSEKLQFNWDEVHEVAEELEHVSNEKLINKLDEFLNFPRFDPHGDPIPDASGKIEISRQIALSELALNKVAVVCHVKDQSADMLELLDHKAIALGTRLEVKKKFDFDGSIELKIGKQPLIHISRQLAENIYVKI